MDIQALYKTIDTLYPQYLKIWEDICNIESPTSYKIGVDAVGKYLIDLTMKKGWQVSKLPQEVSGEAICITMNPDATELPIALSGHMDTVHPVGSFGSPAVTMDEEKIYGPGVQDCKGGLVVGLLAMDALEKNGYRKRPVMLLLQSDEETGSRGSGKQTIRWICQQAKDAIAFLNLESSKPNEAVIARKGIARYQFTVHGKQAHSGKCINGANAIAHAAHMILELEKFKDTETLTCNCGTISGGTTPNTVPGLCTFVADFRYDSAEDLKRAEQAVESVANTEYIPGCTCSYSLISSRVSMPVEQRNLDLLEKANAILADAGIAPMVPAKQTGGSDAADASASGIPCLDNFGVQGGASHSQDEFALLSSLASCAKHLAIIVAGL